MWVFVLWWSSCLQSTWFQKERRGHFPWNLSSSLFVHVLIYFVVFNALIFSHLFPPVVRSFIFINHFFCLYSTKSAFWPCPSVLMLAPKHAWVQTSSVRDRQHSVSWCEYSGYARQYFQNKTKLDLKLGWISNLEVRSQEDSDEKLRNWRRIFISLLVNITCFFYSIRIYE